MLINNTLIYRKNEFFSMNQYSQFHFKITSFYISMKIIILKKLIDQRHTIHFVFV